MFAVRKQLSKRGTAELLFAILVILISVGAVLKGGFCYLNGERVNSGIEVGFLSQKKDDKQHIKDTDKKDICIVIDPGHGGNDPGKVGGGNGDVLEKDLNLQIGLLLKGELEKDGFHVAMTRTDDVTATGESNAGKGEDLNKRIQVINEEEADYAISIHQNSYTDSAIKGAQVFYYAQSEEGKKLAASLQKSLIEKVDPDNTRQAKDNNSYYLLLNTKCPTVIVECGFLSNPQEAELLKSGEYQQQIADAIKEGLVTHLQEK